MESLNQETADEYQDVLDELQAQIAELRASLEQYAESVTALLLNLREARQELSE